jgi:hypothetical protein
MLIYGGGTSSQAVSGTSATELKMQTAALSVVTSSASLCVYTLSVLGETLSLSSATEVMMVGGTKGGGAHVCHGGHGEGGGLVMAVVFELCMDRMAHEGKCQCYLPGSGAGLGRGPDSSQEKSRRLPQLDAGRWA